MAAPVTWEAVRELAGFRSKTGCAFSLYLDLDPSSTPTPADAETRLRSLLARAEKARDVLPAGLTERGYAVDVLAVYRTVTATPDPDVLERVRRGDVDALTFTSSSTVANLCDLLGDVPSPQPLLVSIGPVTSKTAFERGLRVDVEAAEHTIDGLVDALLGALSIDGA